VYYLNVWMKVTLPKFRHADKETNAMHRWVELWIPKLNRWWNVGDTSLSVINYFEKGREQGQGGDFLNCVNPSYFWSGWRLTFDGDIVQHTYENLCRLRDISGSGASSLWAYRTHCNCHLFHSLPLHAWLDIRYDKLTDGHRRDWRVFIICMAGAQLW